MVLGHRETSVHVVLPHVGAVEVRLGVEFEQRVAQRFVARQGPHRGVEVEVELRVAMVICCLGEQGLLGAHLLPQVVDLGVGDPFDGLPGSETVEHLADLEDVAQTRLVERGHLGADPRGVFGKTFDDELLHRLADWAARHLQTRGEARHAQWGARGHLTGEDLVAQSAHHRLSQQCALTASNRHGHRA